MQYNTNICRLIISMSQTSDSIKLSAVHSFSQQVIRPAAALYFMVKIDRKYISGYVEYTGTGLTLRWRGHSDDYGLFYDGHVCRMIYAFLSTLKYRRSVRIE